MAASDHLNQAQFYHGSLDKFSVGDVLTPEGRDPEGSIHAGKYVYATPSAAAARYFASMHDVSPNTDAPTYVHKVEPIGAVEPDQFPGEREQYSHGNIRAKGLRVTGHL